MYPEQIAEEMFAAVVTAAATLVAGYVATLISSRLRKRKDAAKVEIEGIAASVRDERENFDSNKIEEVITRTFQQHSADKDTITAAVKSAMLSISANRPASPAVENLIAGYHEQALNQARAQFWFSVMAATVGFIWILYTGMDIKPADVSTYFKTLPGAVMDAVAFLFFRQAAETRQRATDLYDRLRRDKQTMESITLVASIEDTRVRSAVKAQMALHMAGLDPSPINLTNFLSSTDSTPSVPLPPPTKGSQVINDG